MAGVQGSHVIYIQNETLLRVKVDAFQFRAETAGANCDLRSVCQHIFVK